MPHLHLPQSRFSCYVFLKPTEVCIITADICLASFIMTQLYKKPADPYLIFHSQAFFSPPTSSKKVSLDFYPGSLDFLLCIASLGIWDTVAVDSEFP